MSTEPFKPSEWNMPVFPPLPEDYVPPPTAPWAPGQPFGPGGSYRSEDEDAPPPRVRDVERERDLDARRQVYFLRRVTDGAIKIGTSTRPESRMYAMRAQQRCYVELLATMPGGLRQEQLMHARFARSRIDGEWFKPSRFLLAFIDKLNGVSVEPPSKDRP